MPMETSVRILFNSPVLTRHSPSSSLARRVSVSHSSAVSNLKSSQRQHVRPPLPIFRSPCYRLASITNSFACLNSPIQNSSLLGFFCPFSASESLDYSHSNRFDPFVSDSNSKSKFFEWSLAKNGGEGVLGKKGPLVTAVLLGWLGAQPKHMRRYVELYNSRGIHAVTLVASVGNVLSFDLGKELEKRISLLARELASWLEEKERDGRDRFLIFHTFSNTGWLAYGSILENLKSRQDLLAKIRGCIVDSGGDPHINPRVFAAGFTAALLGKRSSSAYPSMAVGEGIRSEMSSSETELKEPLLVEIMLLVAFEKLFSFLLNLPAVKQRLTKIISTLMNDPPRCPQLCLYSTADKVIPSESVEEFIEDQQKRGRKVWSYNFGISPHVDHYRTFPDIYSSQLQDFLKECLAT
ncbi:hypothetical protein NMG60_11026213 [Bertholletia excelsa]